MRLAAFLITAVVQFVAGVFGLFILLIGLNGYSERQATPGMIFYVTLGLLSILSLSFGSAFSAKRLVDRKILGTVAASVTATILFSIIGVAILFAGLFVALMLAEFMRKV